MRTFTQEISWKWEVGCQFHWQELPRGCERTLGCPASAVILRIEACLERQEELYCAGHPLNSAPSARYSIVSFNICFSAL
eukprot:2492963-Amphidinium_carterae.1